MTWGPAALAQDTPVPVTKQPATGPYLVVAVDLSDDAATAGYRAAAAKAREHHGGVQTHWDGADFDVLDTLLRAHRPQHVLFVLRPASLDLVLHRRILLASAKVDDDPCVDFAFGYFTAGTGAECEALWARTVALHARGALTGEWWQASVCSADKSFRIADGQPPLGKAAGFRGPHFYFANRDPERGRLVDEALGALGRAVVAEFTGCGDPQGIWLFDDDRNRQRDKHWDYDPAKVGSDPDGGMPRLFAERFRELKLASPIVWSGTCHSGACERVFVEGDIVSTFGRTKRVTVHRLSPKDSLALSWLHAGAAALCVPLGANHGLAVSNETDFALVNGASLGEVLKSTWDDVFLAADGALVLDLPVAGEPHARKEKVMQGGGANRILIGDPSLRPFRPASDARERVQVERTATGLRVTVARAKGFVARAWDMYGVNHFDDWRVTARIDLGALGVVGGSFTATVAATGDGDVAMPYRMRRCVVEDWHGQRLLHLQANGVRAEVENKAVTAVFEVVAAK
ncbi:MAG: hypothetical protein WAT39_00950 [Planctomycetota bacterium]